MIYDSKIYVAGHKGLIGSSLVKKLCELGYRNLLLKDKSQVNLINQDEVRDLFLSERPDYVFLAAASVGSIETNLTLRGEFLYNNLQIQSNVIHQSYLSGVKKLLLFGSSSVYPVNVPQPLKEEYLLDGRFEYSTEPDAIAKMTGIKLCDYYRDQYNCNFVSVMPSNVYGVNDNYSLEKAHVIPSLVRKMYEAKKQNLPVVEIWGTGSARREFLFADDLAEGALFLMLNYNKSGAINIGVGKDISIKELAYIIRDIVGFQGDFVFNTSRPEGIQNKLLDIEKITSFGWLSKTKLIEGIELSYRDFLQRFHN